MWQYNLLNNVFLYFKLAKIQVLKSLRTICDPFAKDYAIDHVVDDKLTKDHELEQNDSNMAAEKKKKVRDNKLKIILLKNS